MGLLRAVTIAMVGLGALVLGSPPLAQDPGYHDMADQRSVLGIPNGLNVLSNLPFAIVGLLGLASTFRRSTLAPPPFDDPWVRWPWAATFGGTLLTAFGSAWYHVAPNHARLVWDRLPMTLAFMGVLVAVLAERVSVPVARSLFAPLLVLGPASVVFWYWGESRGAGDLRPYVLVQFGSLVMVVLIVLLYRGRRRDTAYWAAAVFAYAAAKALEWADRPVFAAGHLVSGHTLKHLAAAGALACLAAMVRGRCAGKPER